MTLGIRGQTKRLIDLLDESGRFVDFAVQFEVFKKRGKRIVSTGDFSPVFGGRWDQWAGEYVGDAKNILTLQCSAGQYGVVMARRPRIEAAGGRGSGKSEGGLLRAIRMIAERPGEKGQIVSPIHKLTLIVWEKILRQLPRDWLLPGNLGIRFTERRLVFVNGTAIRFMSANNPNGLRSWGGGWSFIDEEQDISDEAINIIWPSLRESPLPSLWTAGTPKPGVYAERHKRLLNSPDAKCFSFDSYSNPFISHKTFEIAKSQMDEKTYRQEIGGEWVFDEDVPLVVYCFDREKHGTSLPIQLGREITREITKRKSGVEKGWIAGVDYNWNYPNYAVLYKIYAPNKWIAHAIVHSKGHAGHLGAKLKEKGFRDSLIIDDASGRYNRGPRSSSRLLRGEGFTVVHPIQNPHIKVRITALLRKMAPVEGEISWFMALPECEELAESMTHLEWRGEKIDKSAGYDHIFDAATYPVAYFEPITNVASGKIKGLVA